MTMPSPTDTSLLRALETYRSAIPGHRAHEFRLDSLDRLDIPLWAVFVWAEDGDFSDGYGYGSNALAAQVSAWGEIMENYFATETLRALPRRRASYGELLVEGSEVCDPLTLCLDAAANYTAETSLVWTRATRWPSGEKVWVPLEAAAISPGDILSEIPAARRLFMPITNGLGAGMTLPQAITHGILEQVQRDGDSVTFRALDQGVRIDLRSVQDQGTRELLAYLDARGVEVMAKLAGVALGMAVIYVVGHERDLHDVRFNLSISACGEAADPDPERALRKALDEFVSSRARKRFMHGSLADMRSVAPERYCERVESDPLHGDEPRALQSLVSWTRMTRQELFGILQDPVFACRSVIPFSELPGTSAPSLTEEGRLELLGTRLAREGSEVLYVDFTPPGASFHVVKTCCPRLEVETMSYGRIGRRNLERLCRRAAEDPAFAGLVGISDGDRPAGSLPIHLTASDEAALGGKGWLDPAAIERVVGKLYALYREPNGHTVGKLAARHLETAALPPDRSERL